MMVVVATDADDVVPSPKQFTTVPFQPLLTELMAILDITGELYRVDSRDMVTMVVLSVNSSSAFLGRVGVTGIVLIVSEKTVNSHVRNMSDTVHVSSSSSPTRQTGATRGGDISATPVGTLQ